MTKYTDGMASVTLLVKRAIHNLILNVIVICYSLKACLRLDWLGSYSIPAMELCFCSTGTSPPPTTPCHTHTPPPTHIHTTNTTHTHTHTTTTNTHTHHKHHTHTHAHTQAHTPLYIFVSRLTEGVPETPRVRVIYDQQLLWQPATLTAGSQMWPPRMQDLATPCHGGERRTEERERRTEEYWRERRRLREGKRGERKV